MLEPVSTWVLSDLHVRAGQERPEAIALLREAARHSRAIVLNGDVWDLSWWPWEDAPPSPAEVISSAPGFRDALREVAGMTRLVIVVGNHDVLLTQAVVDDALYPEGVPADPRWRPVVVPMYRDGAIRVHHGHRDALLNAPDPAAPDELPLGWWLTRAAASAGLPGHPTPPVIAAAILNGIEMMLGPDTLAEAIVDAAMEMAEAAPDDAIVLRDGSLLPWADVRTRYRDIWGRWTRRVGFLRALEALQADTPGPHGLDAAMAAMVRASKARVVVTGHTHVPGIATYRGAVIANSGAFGPDGRRDGIRIWPTGNGMYSVALTEGLSTKGIEFSESI